MCTCAAAIFILLKRAFAYYNNRPIVDQDTAHRLQDNKDTFQTVVQDYELVRNAGVKSSTGQHELQDSLTVLSSDTCLKGQINPVSFGSAFDSLLGEVKKARGSIQQCYDKLNEGITIVEINIF